MMKLRSLEDSDDIYNAEPAPCTLDNRQLDNDTLKLETLPTLSGHPSSKRGNDHGISNGESTVTAKRQRSVSPQSTICHASTPLLPQNKGRRNCPENMDSNEPDESGDNDVRSKRRRISAQLSSQVVPAVMTGFLSTEMLRVPSLSSEIVPSNSLTQAYTLNLLPPQNPNWLRRWSTSVTIKSSATSLVKLISMVYGTT